MRVSIFISILLLIYGCSEPIICTCDLDETDDLSNDSLIAYYTLDGNALDFSGNENHGEVFGAQPTRGINGASSSGYYFDGTNDNILVEKFPFPEGEITISLWAKTNSRKKQAYIKTLSNETDRLFFGSHYLTTGNTYPSNYDTYWDFGVNADNVTNRIFGDLLDLKIDTWEHFVVTHSRSENQMKVYHNGILVLQDNVSSTVNLIDETLAIGGSPYIDQLDYFFHGCLDEIKIFDLVLDETKVLELFNE